MLDEKNCNFFKQTGETANYRENSEPFPCLYHIPRFSTAFSVKLIRLSAKTATESPPPFFPLIYTSFYPIRAEVQPYQFSAVLAFDLKDRPLRLCSLIVQNAPPAFGVGASDHFHLPPPPLLHSGQ